MTAAFITAKGRSSVRHHLLTGAAALALASLLAPDRAEAQDACGPLVQGAATCTPADNPFPDGIVYRAQPVVPGANVADPTTPMLDLTVVLDDGVAVVLAPSPIHLVGVGAYGRNNAAVTISGAGASVVTTGDDQYGVAAVGRGTGAVRISIGDVSTAGARATGILASGRDTGDVSVDVGSVRTSGDNSPAILAANLYGNITIDAGEVSTSGAGSAGIQASAHGAYGYSNYGNIAIAAGTVATSGDNASQLHNVAGIYARSDYGSATITADSVTTTGFQNYGITSHTAFGTTEISVHDVSVSGANGVGISVRARDAVVNLDGTLHSTSVGMDLGGGGFYNSGSATINLTGDIVSQGDGVHGLFFNNMSVVGGGTVTSTGARGIVLVPQGGSTVIDLSRVDSFGPAIEIISTNSDVNVSVADITSSNSYGAGITSFLSEAREANFTSTGTVTSHGTGVSITFAGDGTANVNNVTATGDNSSAVRVRATDSATINITGIVNSSGDQTNNTLAGAVRAEGLGIGSTATIDNDGTIIAAGARNRGIYASADTNVVVTGTGSVTTNGSAATGIIAVSNGDLSVTQDSVTTMSEGSKGIVAVNYSATGSTMIHVGSVDTQTTAMNGVTSTGIRAVGSGGSIDIIAGSVATHSDRAIGIAAYGHGGPIGISAGSTTTTGARATGIYATTDGAGSIAIDAGNVTTRGAGAHGIYAYGHGAGAVSVSISGHVSTSGDQAGGIYSYSYGGAASIDLAGSVSTEGDGATGMFAYGRDTAEISGGGSVSTTGSVSQAVRVTSFNGDAIVNVGDIMTSGLFSLGINAFARQGDVDIIVGNVTTTGAGAQGIYAIALQADATVTSTGTIAVSGQGAAGVHVRAIDGLATVSVRNVSEQGSNAAAIDVRGAAVDLTIVGAVSGAGDQQGGPGAAVFVGAFTPVCCSNLAGGEGIADIRNDGAISASGQGNRGILAIATNDIIIHGTGTVASSGPQSSGIGALSYAGGVSVTQARVTTTGDGSAAVNTRAYGGDTFVKVGTVRTSGAGSNGVNAIGAGDISLDITDAEATGPNSILISAMTPTGSVRVTSTGTLGVSGDGSTLLTAATAGPIDLTLHNLNVAGNGSAGVIARGGGNVTLGINGNVTDSAAQAAPGFAVDVTARGAAVVTNSGTFRASADNLGAISARAINGVTVTSTGTIVTTGQNGLGIYAGSNNGFATVSATSIRTSGALADALVARSFGTTTVNAGTIATSGYNAFGVIADGGQSATATVASISTSGAASNGLNVRSYGAATANVGTISTGGAGSNAVVVSGGTATLNATGAIISTGAAGLGGTAAIVDALNGAATANLSSVIANGSGMRALLLSGTSTVSLNIAAGGTIQGNRASADLVSGTGATVRNAGSILAGNGAALSVSGGAAVIVNTGTIAGPVLLTDNADSIANNGLLIFGSGSTFGAGNDALTNTGTVALGASLDFGAGTDGVANSGIFTFVSRSAPLSLTAVGLESFANSGAIDLRNTITGDVLTLPGAYFGSGNAQLLLDANAGTTPSADRLVIGGVATGSTTIGLNISGSPVLLSGLTLVQSGAGTSATAFQLSPASSARGLIAYALLHDAGATRFYLVGAPAPAVFRTLKITEGAEAVWLNSADAVSAQLDTERDSAWAGTPAGGGRVWGQMFGRVARRDDARGFTQYGFTQTVDAGYAQDFYGFQLGAGIVSRGAFTFGITAGYQSSSLDFDANADRVRFEDYDGGVYAGFRSGALFLNALVKYDHYDIRTLAPSVQLAGRSHGYSYGGRLEGGLRLGSTRFYIEPAAGISYVRSDIDSLLAYGAAIAFDRSDGLRGTAGLRLGGRSDIGGGNIMIFYAGGEVVHEFDGNDGIGFTTGGTTLAYRNNPIGTYGKGKLGFSITAGRVTGFIEGDGIAGRHYSGGDGRVGLRVAF